MNNIQVNNVEVSLENFKEFMTSVKTYNAVLGLRGYRWGSMIKLLLRDPEYSSHIPSNIVRQFYEL